MSNEKGPEIPGGDKLKRMPVITRSKSATKKSDKTVEELPGGSGLDREPKTECAVKDDDSDGLARQFSRMAELLDRLEVKIDNVNRNQGDLETRMDNLERSMSDRDRRNNSFVLDTRHRGACSALHHSVQLPAVRMQGRNAMLALRVRRPNPGGRGKPGTTSRTTTEIWL